MRRLRVTFRGCFMDLSPVQRAINELKDFYWQSGVELPDNWDEFEGNITVNQVGDMYGVGDELVDIHVVPKEFDHLCIWLDNHRDVLNVEELAMVPNNLLH